MRGCSWFRRTTVVLWLLAGLLSGRVLRSAGAAWAPREPVDQPWRVTSLLEPSGLGSRNIFAIDFERTPGARFGTAWIATSDGLYEYDGYTARRHGTAEGLPSDFIRAVRVTRAGEVWVGTDRGVGTYGGAGRFDSRGSERGLAGPNVRRIVEEPDGTVWFCSDTWPSAQVGGGLTSYREGEWRAYTTRDGLGDEYVVNFIRDAAGRRYAARLGGVDTLEGGRWVPVDLGGTLAAKGGSSGTFAEMPGGGLMYSVGDRVFVRTGDRWEERGATPEHRYGLCATSDGVLLGCGNVTPSRKRLVAWGSAGWEPVSAEFTAPHNYVEDVVEAPDGAVWVIGYECLVRWERRGGEWTEYELPSLPYLVDGRGAVWFHHGSWSRTAAVRPYRHLVTGEWEALDLPCWRIVADSRGDVWGWGTDVLCRWSGGDEQRFDAADLGFRRWLHGTPDNAGGFWAAGEAAGGAVRLAVHRSGSWQVESEPLGVSGSAVEWMGAGGEGIWVLVDPPDQRDLVAVRVRDGRRVQVDVPEALKSRFRFGALAPGDGEDLWLHGETGAFVRRGAGTGGGVWEAVAQPMGKLVFGMIERPDGLWMGCSSSSGGQDGVVRWRGGVATSFATPTLTNLRLAPDGTLLLGAAGLFTAVPPGADANPVVVQMPEPFPANSVIRDGRGVSWIGTGERVFRYQPNGVPPIPMIHPADTNVLDGRTLVARIQARDRFRPDSWPARHEFSWRVGGGAWSSWRAGGELQVPTEDLRVGVAMLEVRARDTDGNAELGPAVVAFRVLPLPIQSRPWFTPALATATLLLAGVSAAAFRARSLLAGHARHLEQRVAERTAELKADVMERRRVARELEVANRHLRVLTQCNAALVRATDERGLLDTVCRIVTETGGFPAAWVGVADRGPDRSVQLVGHAAKVPGGLLPGWGEDERGVGPTGTAIRTGKPCLVADIRSVGAEWAVRAVAFGHASVCSVPLISNGIPFAALTVCSGTRDAFPAGEVALLEDLARDLAFGLAALRTRGAHERAEAELRRSDARLRLALGATQLGVWEWDPVGGGVQWSGECGLILGPEGLGTTLADWLARVHADDVAAVTEAFESVRRTGAALDLEFRLVLAGRGVRWVATLGRPNAPGSGEAMRVIGTIRDVTDRREASEQLRASEERFRQVVETIEEVFWMATGDGGEVLFVSAAFERIWGRRSEDLLRGSAIWLESVHPEDRSRMREKTEALAHGEPYDEEYRIQRPDGSTRWIHDRGFPVRDAQGRIYRSVGVAEDVTERRQAREELRRFLSLSPSVLYAFRVEERGLSKLWLSPNLEPYTGYSVAEAGGLEWWLDRIHPEDRERVAAAHPSPYDIDHQVLEYRLMRKDGGYRWLRDEKRLVRDSAGHPSEVVGAVSDVTDRVELEAQLRQSQKMQALGQLSGGIAHDFNNILGAIVGNADLARSELPAGHPVLDSLDGILAASGRARNLVQQILAFARLRPPERRRLSVRESVRETARLLRATLPAQITLEVAPSAEECWALGDPTQLQQVWLNLGTNAWHAIGDRPGRITFEMSRVSMTSRVMPGGADLAPGEYIRVSVRDTGSGMDAGTLERLFEPFFTTKPPGQGTGLGLPVVHGIVRRHEGAVTVQSSPGTGTTFEVYLPASEALAGETPAAASSAPAMRVKRILLVDDERALLSVVKRVLERAGHRVTGFSDPHAAVALMRDSSTPLDLVITDHNMPGLTGLEVAAEVQRLRPGTPVIITSGYITEEMREIGRAFGVREWIDKSDISNELAAALGRLGGG